jgi:hypothetical protein
VAEGPERKSGRTLAALNTELATWPISASCNPTIDAAVLCKRLGDDSLDLSARCISRSEARSAVCFSKLSRTSAFNFLYAQRRLPSFIAIFESAQIGRITAKAPLQSRRQTHHNKTPSRLTLIRNHASRAKVLRFSPHRTKARPNCLFIPAFNREIDHTSLPSAQ